MTSASTVPPAGFLHPAGRPYRFTVLGFASALLFGSYFAYDSVGAIENTLMELLGVGADKIGASYTMYSLAAIPTVFVGGMLIDRLGVRKASLLFSALVTAGAVIVALAPSLWVLYLGRLVFGMGSESLVVAQSAIIARWFTGKELALAFGIALTVSRLGTSFTFNTETVLAQHWGVAGALWTAAILCGISLLCNVVFNLLDARAEAVLGLPRAEGGDKIVLADIRKFDSRFWSVTLLCVTFYSAIFPFTALATHFFHEKWGLPLTSGSASTFLQDVFSNFLHMFSTAPGTTSIIINASMLFAPFAGTLVDRVGKRATLMIFGSLCMIPAHLLMGVTHLPPQYLMVVLGAAFVLVPAAMWPSVPLVVDKQRVGTAFGLMTMIQNLGLMLFPWFNGLLRESTGGYTASQVMFACLGAAGLLFAFLLRSEDARHGGVLERGRVAPA